MGCPLQFLPSIRFVSLCSCLSQICSDIHSRSCWTLELSAVHLLLLMWIGCIGQFWGRVEVREAISNGLTARVKPFNLEQLCGGSWGSTFLNKALSYCSVLEGGQGWAGIFVGVFLLFSVSSAPLFSNGRMYDIQQGWKYMKLYKWEKEVKPMNYLEGMKLYNSLSCIFSQHLFLLESFS